MKSLVHPGLERKLLLKIDWCILSYCCLMYFTNYLDRSNVNNAYVSGMKEELHMFGNQFNKINTIFTCGYIVGMIPNNLMIQIVRPRIWLPSMQIVWAVLTFCTSTVHTVEQVYAIRFLQGLAESSTFVGTHYILGSWYKPSELGKRSGIFTSSGLVGTLFSGVLQAAVYKNLNNVSGRSGWRWLFIIDGVITLPIALYGYIIFPDVPADTTAFYLSEEERDLAVKRVPPHHPPRLSFALVKRMLRRWRWYGCTLLFTISGETESLGSNNIMGQWLKSIGGYTVEQIDNYPSGVSAFGIFSTLLAATITDLLPGQPRWPVLVYMAICCVVGAICILVWSSPTGAKFFGYYLAAGSYAGQATTFSWANQICFDDDQERAITLASMNMFNNVLNAWWPLVFYPATDAPRFQKGMITLICVSVATLLITFLVWAFERKEKIMRRGSDAVMQGDEEEHVRRGEEKRGEKSGQSDPEGSERIRRSSGESAKVEHEDREGGES